MCNEMFALFVINTHHKWLTSGWLDCTCHVIKGKEICPPVHNGKSVYNRKVW